MNHRYELLLADDDIDDCSLFKEALGELPNVANLSIVNNGSELMHRLKSGAQKMPDAIFLDLNMPLKNGFECLTEIKEDKKLQTLPVIIYSTSFDLNVVDLLYEKGAQFYIRKPGSFSMLKKTIQAALAAIANKIVGQPSKEKFVIEG